MTSGPRPRRWTAIADVIGLCIVIFAFVPVLVEIPLWVRAEVRNSLNMEDPIVLAFLPARLVIALLDRFDARLLPGSIAGALSGMVLALWGTFGRPLSRGRELSFGAGVGGLAALAVVVMIVALQHNAGGPIVVPRGAVAFELAAGAACGMIAIGSAMRRTSPCTADGSRS